VAQLPSRNLPRQPQGDHEAAHRLSRKSITTARHPLGLRAVTTSGNTAQLAEIDVSPSIGGQGRTLRQHSHPAKWCHLQSRNQSYSPKPCPTQSPIALAVIPSHEARNKGALGTTFG